MSMHLRKYYQLFRAGFIKASFYRLQTIASFFSSILYLVLLYAVWSSIASSGNLEGGLTKVISYLLLGQVITNFVSMNVEGYFGERIRKGTITNDLKRPVSIRNQSLLHEGGRRSYNVLFKSLPLLVLGFIFTGLQAPSIINGIGFLVSLILSFFLMYSIAFSTSMLVFWTKIDSGIRFTRSMMVDFFSGVIFPLYLLPEPLRQIFFALPFQYIVDGPINVFLMETTGRKILTLLGQQLLWIAIFFVTGELLWRKAKTKLTVQGG